MTNTPEELSGNQADEASQNQSTECGSVPERNPQEHRWAWRENCELVLLILAAFGPIWMHFRYDAHLKNLERAKAENDVMKFSTPVVEIDGQILAPNASTEIDSRRVDVHPLRIQVKNSGDIPIRIGSIQLQFFRASVKDIAKIDQRKFEEIYTVKVPVEIKTAPEKGGIVKVGATTETVMVTEERTRTVISTTGVIDSNSPNWNEVISLRESINLGDFTISHGQSRQHTFHILVPPPVADEFRRFVVTVNPADGESWTPIKWQGNADPVYCFPGPNAPGFGEPVSKQ